MRSASERSTTNPPIDKTPARTPATSARRRNASMRSGRSALAASAVSHTAARYALVTTLRKPIRIDVGLIHDDQGSPAALPTGTRSEAIPPIAAPNANGVRNDEI